MPEQAFNENKTKIKKKEELRYPRITRISRIKKEKGRRVKPALFF
jgi:hypothetical protein